MNLYRRMRIAKRLLAVSFVGSIAAITTSDAFAEESRKKYPGAAHANAFVIEEVIVEGERPDPDSMALNTMEVIYHHKETSARNFKIGNYRKAFPSLVRLAKLGFKDEQARVGYIYLHGLGNQPKSNLKALGWLGVAAQGKTRPQYHNLLAKLLDEVPEHQRTLVDSTITEYQKRFAAENLGVTCERSRTGHLDKFTCLFDAQRSKHLDRLLMIAKTGGVPWVLGPGAIAASITDEASERISP